MVVSWWIVAFLRSVVGQILDHARDRPTGRWIVFFLLCGGY